MPDKDVVMAKVAIIQIRDRIYGKNAPDVKEALSLSVTLLRDPSLSVIVIC